MQTEKGQDESSYFYAVPSLAKVNCVDTLQRVLAEIYNLCLLFCQGSLEITQLRNSFFDDCA